MGMGSWTASIRFTSASRESGSSSIPGSRFLWLDVGLPLSSVMITGMVVLSLTTLR